MKAKHYKNGSWTISGISSEQIVALSKVLKFAKEAEMGYGHNLDTLRPMIDGLRSDGNTLAVVSNIEFFSRCLSQDIRECNLK